jgi:hypothetical protein
MVTSGFMKHPISVSIKPAAAQIVAVQGKDVEGVQLHLIVMWSAVQTIEVRDAVYA